MNLADAPAALKVEQVAELLQLSRGATYEGIRTGQIPSVRVGRTIRVPRHRLEQMLDGAEPRQNGGGDGLTPAA